MALNCSMSYSRNVDPLLKIMKPVYEKYFKLLQWHENNISILDVGIGDGRMTKEVLIPSIPKSFSEFIGCDTSDSVLENSRNLSSFKTIKMDIATSQLPANMVNRFNKVFSTFCLHNVKNSR